ncbi:hypothetical protein [Comamonas sp.]|uniref:hypothetical protein n=1 Tax=Comamonas sp. TaxID=34028 RepID=UPI00289786BB|nr:hypothetical protein [Comamonas sp.]
MTIKDTEVITALTSTGIPLERWLALAGHLTGYVDDTGSLKANIIEDDALAAAAVKFLQERGQVHQSFKLNP